mmetsp:Transcript_9473/g.16146  ORF Transcript_9473/g.16146 Transcript_9473/m.16146 type:complete len:120 (+) Transcript_9473:61-420(+)
MDSDSDPSSPWASLDEAEEEDDNSSSEASVDNQEEDWLADLHLQRIRENNPITSRIHGRGEHNFLHNMTDEEWEELGRDCLTTPTWKMYILKTALSPITKFHFCLDTSFQSDSCCTSAE